MYSEKPKLRKRQELHKPGSLRTIALDVTPRCNMSCPHCYAETFNRTSVVGLAELEKTQMELYDMGVYHYVLQGGEPILDPARLEHIINNCYPDETYINVVSNGWNMTRDKILWLKGLKVDKLSFSMDSGIEAEHDANRAAGSFKRVVEAIDNVLNAGLLASISVVVTHASLYSEGFKMAYEFAKSKRIRIDVQIAEPVGKWDGKTDVLLTPDDSGYIKQLQINCPRLPSGQKMLNRDIFSGADDHCPAVTEFMAITANGEVLPCNFLQFTLGKIGDKSFGEMRNALMGTKWFNGEIPNCLCGENKDFIDLFVLPYVNATKPLDAYEIFGITGGGVGTMGGSR
ncbi:MAG: radical SAM protein [Nitrospirae bacterium]|nr:radical SAM protein [Nitrospirota bacterium]